MIPAKPTSGFDLPPAYHSVEGMIRRAVLPGLAVLALATAAVAGDILRGGATADPSRRNAAARANAGAEAAASAKRTAEDRLARTTKVIESLRRPNVPSGGSSIPNGLVAGGLFVANQSIDQYKWIGANLPTQNGGTVTVVQTAQTAQLYWESFNIGRTTTLRFDQSAGKTDVGKWIAFNHIVGNGATRIAGTLIAPGQAYIINPSGIRFEAGAQVTARTLVASTLPINGNLIERGLLNQEKNNAKFLFSGLPSDGYNAFNPSAPIGDVTVETGAFLSSPVSEEGYGGRVMLVGRNVSNAGVIATPSGQTILAAGLQVGIDAHSTSDPSLRGLDVYVGAVSDAGSGLNGGDAINTGLIESAQGSITMVGRRVLQNGALESSTSVDVNGRVDLLANYDAIPNSTYDPTSSSSGSLFLVRSSGFVEMGEGSLLRILPEWNNPKLLATSSLSLRSAVNMQGRSIHFARGASLLAPNAKVNLNAGRWIYETTGSPRSTFVHSTGQIYLDENTLIDVSGSTDVFIPMAHSIMTLQLRGSELADSPLQRSANLRAVELTMDMRLRGSFYGREWVGTPLGDVTGYLNLVERNVTQLTMEGGDITMNAGESVVIRKGAILDASGGYARNEGGKIQTTRLKLGRNLINIHDATPDRIYDGIYDGKTSQSSQKWGVSKTFLNALAPLGAYTQREYIAGANAGTISISAPSMALDGEMSAGRIIGPRQLRDSMVSSSLPRAGRLELRFEAQDDDPSVAVNQFGLISPTPPKITFMRGFEMPPPPDFVIASDNSTPSLSQSRISEVAISPDLLDDKRFASLLIRNGDGEILISSGTTLRVPAGGELDFTGANIKIDGSIFAPGGTINFVAFNFSPYLAKFLNFSGGDPFPNPNPARGLISLASGSVISAAGQIHDDRPTGSIGATDPISISGGEVTLEAYSIDLKKGSSIDVSGGIAYGANGKYRYGNAGAISILAGQDPNLDAILGGELNIESRLAGFSGARGGSLTIKAPLVQVGGASSREDVFLVQPEFFNQGGFSRFELIGIGAIDEGTGKVIPGMLITAGTVIEPVVSSSVAVPYAQGSRPRFREVLKPVGVRDPVSLTFRSTGVADANAGIYVRGDTILGEGAVIRTDPLGEVTIGGETVAILGSIETPGGHISIFGAGSYPLAGASPGPIALPTVFIGPNARLSAAGTTLLTPDPYGRRRGVVLPGGQIEVSGNIIAAAGAILDVSGASDFLDFTPAELGLVDTPNVPKNSGLNAPLYSLQVQRTRVESNGGSISLKGAQLLITDATLLGRAGGATAFGGFLSLSSGRYVGQNEGTTSADINLLVSQSGQFLPHELASALSGSGNIFDNAEAFSSSLSGDPVALAAYKAAIPYGGMGFFAADTFAAGGFSSLELGGNVRFSGPVSIHADRFLLVGDGGVIEADSQVNLSASYIRIGQKFPIPGQTQNLFTQTPASGSPSVFNPVPTSGPGHLSLSAGLIDVGTLVLKNISNAELSAIGGDIRGSGTFVMAGNLLLRAGQIYPATASKFDIFVYDNSISGVPGSVRIEGAGNRPMPLSAGGSLRIMASEITQGGTLRAPFGTIALGWDGLIEEPINAVVGNAASAPNTPVTKLLTIASGSVTSVSGIDPNTGAGILVPYGISPDGLRWIDPAGNDITLSGLPAKAISFAAESIQMASGSTVDIRGGGDLYAYRWVQGTGGFDDVLANENSFAIVPGYGFNYAPYSPFNPSSTEFLGDPGYVNESLSVGDQITVRGSAALPAGTYTLLPARYALLPGAVLVTNLETLDVGSGDPFYRYQSTSPGSIALEDGSYLVSGFLSNTSTPGRGTYPKASTFQILDQNAIRLRSEYKDFYATDFLSKAAVDREQTAQRLPADSGSVQFLARTGLSLAGSVLASAASTGRGGKIDIAAENAIWITDRGASAPIGAIELNASTLASWGVESLVVGGYRTGDSLTVRANSLTLDNRGSMFSGPEILLAAKQTLTLADNARIVSEGASTQPGGNLKLVGDGALVRVSGDPNALITRTGFANSPLVKLTVGEGAFVSGPGVTLDSTYDTDLNPLALIEGTNIYLNSGRISILLDSPGAASPAFGLVLEGPALTSLAGAGALSLLSYSSLDFYGSGNLPIGKPETLALRAGAIRGFNQAGGMVSIRAGELFLDNSQGASAVAAAQPLDGTLLLDVDKLRVGSNQIAIRQFQNLLINAPGGIHGEGEGGITTDGNLSGATSAITAEGASNQTLAALGDFVLSSSPGPSSFSSGLGARYRISGKSVTLGADILLPSGNVLAEATAGSLSISGLVDLSGTSQDFFDVTRYTDGGKLGLIAKGGDVVISSLVDVSAMGSGGNAGSVSISVPDGKLLLTGNILGTPGTGGKSGSFELDANNFGVLGEFDALNSKLDQGSFFESRTFRARTGDVFLAGTATARKFALGADFGEITISGTIDSHGKTGGSIFLSAYGDLTIGNGATLTVEGDTFSSSGKGGEISLEAGAQRNGTVGPGHLILESGSTLNLHVKSKDSLSNIDEFYGRLSGTLHLRAPRLGGGAGNEIAIDQVGSLIVDPSSILIEGNKVYSNVSGHVTGAAGTITSAFQTTIKNEANSYLGASGSANANYTTMHNRLYNGLLGANPLLTEKTFVLAPGVEIVNTAGGLTLGTTASTATSDWNLASFRFGPDKSPGVLTMRASGDITFYNALSDGFDGGASLWISPLIAHNTLLPANTQTWSYRLTSGADLASADFRSTAGTAGSLKLGKNYGNASNLPGAGTAGSTLQTSAIVASRYQVIRTGSGDINIHAAKDVQLLNQWSTIYTAGTQVANPGYVFTPGDFSTPKVFPASSSPTDPVTRLQTVTTVLGSQQQLYPAQYTLAGGNVIIQAGNDIARLTTASSGLIDDSSRQMPSNWLYRRAYVDPVTGEFGEVGTSAGTVILRDLTASTTWWIDFSNFFEGIGALGGGDVSILAGNDVRNIDAFAPTNARSPSGTPSEATLVELGGGDVSVTAGRDISGGVYYVERGTGTLVAGRSITTNAARSPSIGIVGNSSNLNNPQNLGADTYLATTLFVGKGGFNVNAANDILLGPVSNPFLLPQGIGNKYWYKTYFSTYSPDSYVNVVSLGGDITHRLETTLRTDSSPLPSLQAWYQSQLVYQNDISKASYFQPWLRLVESNVTPFQTVLAIMPPTIKSTSLSGSVNIVGDMTLFPAARGTLEVVAAKQVSGLFATGYSNSTGANIYQYATLNVSDASPLAIPSTLAPRAFFDFVSKSLTTGLPIANVLAQTLSPQAGPFLADMTTIFSESGGFSGVDGLFQTQQARHSSDILHSSDPNPLRIYTVSGDISGITLFSPKPAQVVSGKDISDIAFYIQNISEADTSFVSAARDIVAFNSNSPARQSLAIAETNQNYVTSFGALPGDLQISGPGAFEVLAGRDLDLGTAAKGGVGAVGQGISSIGNARNPFLPFSGAALYVGAGIGPSAGLLGSDLFLEDFLEQYLEEYESELKADSSSGALEPEGMTPSQRAQLAMRVFALVLRDSGREGRETGSFEAGYDAIAELFGKASTGGDINTRNRDIRTRSGGEINIFVPGGSLIMAENTSTRATRPTIANFVGTDGLILASNSSTSTPKAPEGIVTEYGGDISIFTDLDVTIGQGRIFTLRGGDIVIWSSNADIAAGAASKTVASAPPTRVLIDPQTATVETDLSGLATGGGIGVLSTVEGVPEGDVDLIAPRGTVDAGDAGIRASGNLSIAATQILNADNISVGGTSSGVPAAPTVAAPNIGGLSSASSSTGATTAAADNVANQAKPTPTPEDESPSIYEVEVLGYGGGEG